MSFRILKGAALLLAAGLILSASPGRAADAPGLPLVVIGPMSGPVAFQGEVMRDGAKLAVDQINAAGGVGGRKITLQVLDDRNDAKVAVQLAEEAVKSGALAVIGHRSSSTTIAAGKVYKEAHIPAVTGSAAAPEVTAGNPWYFRMLSDTASQGEILAGYASVVLGARKATLLIEESAYGLSLAESFRKTAEGFGLTIEREWRYPEDPAAFKTFIADNPVPATPSGREHLTVLAAPEASARFILPRLRDGGDNSTVLSGQSVGKENFNDHFKDLPAERQQPGFYTDGVIATSAGLSDTAGAEARRFFKAFEDTFGHPADATTMAYYDSTRLIIQGLAAIGATGADVVQERSQLREYLEQRRNPEFAFMGAGGRIYFDQNRSAVQSVPIGRFVHGRFVAAPYQLEIIRDPDKVPDFDTELKAGNIVPMGKNHLSKVQVVYAGIDIIDITSIDMRNGTYKADLFLWLRHQGEIKAADIEFVNAAAPISLGAPIWQRKRGDTTTTTYRIKGVFKADFDYKDYPFDRQTLPLSLRHRVRPTSTFILAVDRLGLSLADQNYETVIGDRIGRMFNATSWRPTASTLYQGMVESDSTLGEVGLKRAEIGLQYAQLTHVIDIKREVMTFFVKNALPLLLIIGVLYAAYYVPPDQVAVRVNIGITSLLASMVLYQRLSADLPSIGYLVLMDYVFFGVFALAIVGVAAGVSAFVANKANKKGTVTVINMLGRTLIPVVLVGAGTYLYRLL